jgi:hypothetical protein
MLVIALFSGALILTGCESGQSGTGGPTAVTPKKESIEADAPSLSAGALSEEMLGQPVQVTGEVVQQCPASGCWFKVKTDSGETFIDLNPSDIRLSDNHVGERARITGKLIKRGSEFAVEATEVEFGRSGGDSPEGEKVGER